MKKYVDGGGVVNAGIAFYTVSFQEPGSSACLFAWAESHYPGLFSPSGPSGVNLQYQSPFIFSYYENTNSYLAISTLDNDVYFQIDGSPLQSAGDALSWLKESGCSH
ncbi:hypothetical protein CCP4SC76_3690007 [Gammaproteobacteria bacterium]